MMINDPIDPHEHLLEEPASAENNWSPRYRGLFVVEIETDGKSRHCIVHAGYSHEGGMREFYDPASGETVGSCGRNYWCTDVKTLADFATAHETLDFAATGEELLGVWTVATNYPLRYGMEGGNYYVLKRKRGPFPLLVCVHNVVQTATGREVGDLLARWQVLGNGHPDLLDEGP